MTTPNDANDRTGRSDGALSGNSSAKQEIRADASAVASQAMETGKAQLDRHKQTAASELDRIADSAEAAARELEDQDRTGISSYLGEAARGMHDLANGMRHKNADELLRDASRIARNNPGLFIAGSIAIGFGLSRLARASAQHDHQPQTGTGMQGNQYSSSAGSTWPTQRATTDSGATSADLEATPSTSDLSPSAGRSGSATSSYGSGPFPSGGNTTLNAGANGRDLTGGPKQ